MTDGQVLCVPVEYVGCDIFFLDKAQNKKYRGRIVGTAPGEEGLISVDVQRLTLSGDPFPEIITMELRLPRRPLVSGAGVSIYSPPKQIIKICAPQPIAA